MFNQMVYYGKGCTCKCREEGVKVKHPDHCSCKNDDSMCQNWGRSLVPEDVKIEADLAASDLKKARLLKEGDGVTTKVDIKIPLCSGSIYSPTLVLKSGTLGIVEEARTAVQKGVESVTHARVQFGSYEPQYLNADLCIWLNPSYYLDTVSSEVILERRIYSSDLVVEPRCS